MALYDPGAQARGTVTVMYTCSGCGLSFDKKRGFDVHRTHRFASPMCRGGFEGAAAERLSLAVTSRDFRVYGRHASVNRPGEREAGKLQRITCITYNNKTLHVLHVITAITWNTYSNNTPYTYYMTLLPLHVLHNIK